MRPLLLAATLLGGCAIDPYRLPGTWRPLGANEQNLRTMAVRPAETLGGSAYTGTDGQRAASAVERWRADRAKPLPESGVARIVPVQTGGASQ